MYYYGGYNGGYSNNSCGCGGGNSYPSYGGYSYGGGYGTGNGYAIILVLFILLVIIIGSRITV